MRRLKGILAGLRRRQRDATGDPASASPPDHRDVHAARALSRAIDQAVAAGQRTRAWRIAAAAERLTDTSPRLAERVARLHLAEGDTTAALKTIEACRTPGASLRLLRAICLVPAGRPADAHLDLHRWAGRSTAPLETRVLLALLEWRAGRRDAARAALHRNLRQIEDPTTLVLLLTMAPDGDAAGALARRLRRAIACSSRRDEAELIIQSLALPSPRPVTEPSPYAVRSLAAELVAAESLVPSLVEAQRLRPDFETIQLLCAALHVAADEFVAPITAVLALAEFELLRDRPDAALTHAREALRRSPMSAAAALIVRRADAMRYGLHPAIERERAA